MAAGAGGAPDEEAGEAGEAPGVAAEPAADTVAHRDAAAGPAGEQLRAVSVDPDRRRALEAVLLVAEEPATEETLAQVLDVPVGEVAEALPALADAYVAERRGFVLRQAGGGWRLYTDPRMATYVERFVAHRRSGKISQAALETLAIIAYKQPVTRGQVGEIRGVDADGAVRSLVQRGLVEEVGRDPSPGQPLLYGTTAVFLEQLGLDSVDELPALPDFDPGGDPPPEPSRSGYKAARRDLGALADDVLASAADPDPSPSQTPDEADDRDDGHQPPT